MIIVDPLQLNYTVLLFSVQEVVLNPYSQRTSASNLGSYIQFSSNKSKGKMTASINMGLLLLNEHSRKDCHIDIFQNARVLRLTPGLLLSLPYQLQHRRRGRGCCFSCWKMLSFPLGQPVDASIAPVRACAQHVLPINILAQGIKAWGEDSSFSLLDACFM